MLTADIPLASRAIDKGCHVLGFTGKPFTTASIGMALPGTDMADRPCLPRRTEHLVAVKPA